MLDAVIQSKTNRLGHITRKNGLFLDAIERKIERRRRFRRRKTKIPNDLKKTRSHGEKLSRYRQLWRMKFHRSFFLLVKLTKKKKKQVDCNVYMN